VIADASLIALLRKIVPPYAISTASTDEAVRVLQNASRAVVFSRIEKTLAERDRVADRLRSSSLIRRVYRSDSNFLLVHAQDSKRVLSLMRDIGILVRDFSGRGTLGEAVRITIGTPEQNDRIIDALCSNSAGSTPQ
jgi:histidinol-phosphate aminotransferase